MIILILPMNHLRSFQIDLSRTVAIAGVILVHSTGIAYGRFGVQLFFVLSGYLLFQSLSYTSISKFLVNRFFRLFPLAAFFIFFFYLDSLKNLDLFANLTLLGNLHWGFSLFPGGWSISNEWIFSLLIVMFFRFGTKTLIMMFFSLLVIQAFLSLFVYLQGGVVEGQIGTETYNQFVWLNTLNPFGNFSCFIMGMLIKKLDLKLKNSLHYFALGSLFLTGVLFDFSVGHFLPLQIICIGSLFIIILNVNCLSQLKISNLIHLLGKTTYGSFFSHFLIIDALRDLDTFLNSSNSMFFLAVLISSTFCGWLSYYMIEKPALALSRGIINRVSPR